MSISENPFVVPMPGRWAGSNKEADDACDGVGEGY
jgi:hypothetical protein